MINFALIRSFIILPPLFCHPFFVGKTLFSLAHGESQTCSKSGHFGCGHRPRCGLLFDIVRRAESGTFRFRSLSGAIESHFVITNVISDQLPPSENPI